MNGHRRWGGALGVAALVWAGIVGCTASTTDSRPRTVSTPAPARLPEPADAPRPLPEAGSVRMSAALVVGGNGMSAAALDRATESFRAVVEKSSGRLRQCYARALARDPHLRGEITVEVVLRQDGAVYNLRKVDDGGLGPDLAACVGEVLTSLSYEPLADGELFSVTAPMRFEPQ